MKAKNRLLLTIFASVMFFACEAQKTENTLPNLNSAETNQNISAVNDNADSGKSAVNENAAVKANTPTNTQDKTDFEGTAGIINKKYEIKSVAVLREVRTARHEGFDRVAFEFAGAEMPGYKIEYIDKPVRQCGSGNVVPLKGDGWLEIQFSPANAHTEEGKPTIKKRELFPNLQIIKELKLTCDFEAEVVWVLGVSSPNHYRVLELKNPTRLAVDIKHK